ncbi:MAG: 6-carboxytetrahydropterin synthase, partial [Candidatus Binatus sp.]
LIKKLTREIVDRLDERTIVPRDSDCLTIDGPRDGVVRIRYEQDEFVLPAADVCIVPIVHSSAEELARYIWEELAAALKACGALKLVTTMEISVAEGPGQSAHYRNSTGDV